MGLKKWRRDKSLEGSAQNSRRTSIGRFQTRSRTSPFSSSFETVMTTSGHHVVRGNEWKVPSPEMMTYMSYEIYTYLYIHSHTMCIQCTVRMNTNTHTVTHPHTHTYMYAQYIQLYTRYTTSGCLTQTPYASWTRDQAESKEKSSLDSTQVSSGSAS